MSDNTAIVGRLSNVRPITGADKIKLADITVHGVTQAQVVVGVESVNDTPMVYFTSNMCLSAPLLEAYPDLARYLGRAGRVRTITLKKVISDGLAVELSKFKKWDTGLKEGDEFTELSDVVMCRRYEPPTKNNPTPAKGDKKKNKLKKFSRLVENQVKLHHDTENFRRNVHKIGPADVVSISRKIHGTSFVCANVLTKKLLTFKEKIAKFFGVTITEEDYDYIYCSRNVVKNKDINLGKQKHFYSYDLWTEVGKEFFEFKLHEGETVYGEIVGYLPTGAPIQKGYHYGCEPNTYEVYVYRITSTNPEGFTIEYTWEQVTARCVELGVKQVETYYVGTLANLMGAKDDEEYKGLVNFLEKKYLGKKAPDCGNRPDEGIVIRKDGLYTCEAYKLKDAAFIAGESASFENGVDDIEESA
jgi:hypothetical protein